MRLLIVFLLSSVAIRGTSQDLGFNFGQVTADDLKPEPYARDTSAVAVFLEEFGEAFIEDGNNYNLIFRYHSKIKILKTGGLSYADYSIPIFHRGSTADNTELVREIKASTFNLENGVVRETPLDQKKIFNEKTSRNWDQKKFALPNVQVGSIIEVYYELESPYIFNFRSWTFQAPIPKIKSTYRAIIPAVYTYNISLRGYLKLTTNTSKLRNDCLTRGDGQTTGFRIDCGEMTYGMVNIPAFKREEFMTAESNFISAINFELAEEQTVTGVKYKRTKEWKDVDQELKQHDNFGVELRKNGDLLKDEIAALLAGTTEPLQRAKKIYAFVQNKFEWDGTNAMYTYDGLKKAVELGKGNAADINLFLVGALREQGFDADPLILSTRANGMVNNLYPVLTEFNYVICHVRIGETAYQLDATDDFYPFGVIPGKCMNGQGRVIDEKLSFWADVKPGDRRKRLTMMNARLEADGTVRGNVQMTFSGYEAIELRKEIAASQNIEEYISKYKSENGHLEIADMKVENLDAFEKPVIQSFAFSLASSTVGESAYLFNPYLIEKEEWEENPFKSAQRQYPVDFATPWEITAVVNLEIAPEFEVVNLPERIGVALPNNGGRHLIEATAFENRVTLSNSVQIAKPVFTSQEYHYLREFFTKVVEVFNADLLIKKKT